MRITLALLACLALGACADAEGARPRLSARPPATASGFGGGYAGASGGFSNLEGSSVPF